MIIKSSGSATLSSSSEMKFQENLTEHGVFMQHRRKMVQTSLSVIPALLLARTSWSAMPLPEQMSREDAIKQFSRWIFIGTLRRTVFLSPDTLKKMLTESADITANDRKLYERHELAKINSGFLEILHALPIFRRSDVAPAEINEIPNGKMYAHLASLGNLEVDSYIESLVGKQCIFFFNHQISDVRKTDVAFPRPLYKLASGLNWRDSLPIPIEELPKVTSIATHLGFVDMRKAKR